MSAEHFLLSIALGIKDVERDIVDHVYTEEEVQRLRRFLRSSYDLLHEYHFPDIGDAYAAKSS